MPAVMMPREELSQTIGRELDLHPTMPESQATTELTGDASAPQVSLPDRRRILDKAGAWLEYVKHASRYHRLTATALYLRAQDILTAAGKSDEFRTDALRTIEGIEFALSAITRVIELQLPRGERNDTLARFAIDWSLPECFGRWQGRSNSEFSVRATVEDCLLSEGRLSLQWSHEVTELLIARLRSNERPLPRLVRVGQRGEVTEFRLLAREDRSVPTDTQIENECGASPVTMLALLETLDEQTAPPFSHVLEYIQTEPSLDKVAAPFVDAWESAVASVIQAQASGSATELPCEAVSTAERTDSDVSQAVRQLLGSVGGENADLPKLAFAVGQIADIRRHAAELRGDRDSARSFGQIARISTALQ